MKSLQGNSYEFICSNFVRNEVDAMFGNIADVKAVCAKLVKRLKAEVEPNLSANRIGAIFLELVFIVHKTDKIESFHSEIIRFLLHQL